jgi:hypothetical protein
VNSDTTDAVTALEPNESPLRIAMLLSAYISAVMRDKISTTMRSPFEPNPLSYTRDATGANADPAIDTPFAPL